MSVSVQESLLDMCDEPSLGALGASVRRTPLGGGAWVDLRRGWLAGSGAGPGRLAERVPWRAEQRRMYDRVVDVPRLLCFYGEDAALPDPALAAARHALSAHYGPELGEAFRTAGLCLYRDGRDSVAWHGDTIGRGRTRGHHGGDRVAGHAAGAAAATARAAGSAAIRGRARRPDGHGRQLPADLGARGAEDGPAVGRGSACSSGRGACAEAQRISRKSRLGDVAATRMGRRAVGQEVDGAAGLLDAAVD